MKKIRTQTELKESYNRLYMKGKGKLCKKTGDFFNDWVLNLVSPGKEEFLLDLSCGQGFFLKRATSWTTHSYGCDISKYAVSEASASVPDSFLAVANAEMLPFSDNVFNVITCLGSLEHYLNPELALKELSRCLTSNGRVFIFVPNGYYIGYFFEVLMKGEGPTHDQELERFEALDFWIKLISDVFFIEKIFKYNPGTGLPLIFAIRQSFELVSQGKYWLGIKFTMINLFFRLIPKNVSKYYGFICRPYVK